MQDPVGGIEPEDHQGARRSRVHRQQHQVRPQLGEGLGDLVDVTGPRTVPCGPLSPASRLEALLREPQDTGRPLRRSEPVEVFGIRPLRSG